MTKRILTSPPSSGGPLPGTKARKWPSTSSSPSTPACRSASAIRRAPGSEEAMRTPTDSSVSTCQVRRSLPVLPTGGLCHRPLTQHTPSTDARLDDTIRSVRRCRCVDRLRTQAFRGSLPSSIRQGDGGEPVGTTRDGPWVAPPPARGGSVSKRLTVDCHLGTVGIERQHPSHYCGLVRRRLVAPYDAVVDLSVDVDRPI